MWPDSLWLIDWGILDLNMNIHVFLDILHRILRNLIFQKLTKILKIRNKKNEQQHEKLNKDTNFFWKRNKNIKIISSSRFSQDQIKKETFLFVDNKW